MSKSITIPSDRGNLVIVRINGKEYSYPAGSTQTVPDEVAAALSDSEANAPKAKQIANNQFLPIITDEDKGKPLVTDETTGEMKWGSGSSNVLVAHATVEGSVIENLVPNDDPVSITLDKTIAELVEAEAVFISIDVTSSGEPVGTSYLLPGAMFNQNSGMCVIYAMLDGTAFDLDGILCAVVSGSLDGSILQSGLMLVSTSSGGDEPFVVTCTPTAADMSGTMDKTPAEIKAAYDAGREIKMRFVVGADNYVDAVPSIEIDGDYIYAYFVFVYLANGTTPVLVNAGTNSSSEATYAVHMYALTPAT